MVLVYRYSALTCATPYLADDFECVADIESRQWLGSASTMALVVPSTLHSAIGDHTFPVATLRSSVEQPSTAGDVITVTDNLLATFEDELFFRSYFLTGNDHSFFLDLLFYRHCTCLCLFCKRPKSDLKVLSY